MTALRKLVAVLLGAAVLSGCGAGAGSTSSQGGSSGGKQVSFSIWWMENRQATVDAFQGMINDFEKANPDIHISFQAYSWQDVKPKALAAINAGTPPDVMQSIPDFLVEIKKTGAVQPVDDIVQAIDQRDHFIPSQLTPYHYDGHYWAVPIFGMDANLYYRKDIFAANHLTPPKTWDELVKDAKALTKDGMYGIAMPQAPTMFTDQTLYTFMINANGDLYDEQNQVHFNTPANVAALRVMKELAPYSPPDSTNWTWQDAVDNFAAGKSAMVLILGLIPSYWYQNQPSLRDQLGMVPPPVADASIQPSTISYSNGFMVLTNDPDKRAAIKKFLLFLSEPDRMGSFLAGMLPGMFLPVTKAVQESKGWNDNPVIKYYRSMIDEEIRVNERGKLFGFTHGVPPASIGPIAADNTLGKIVSQMITNRWTPEQAAQWGQQQLAQVASGQ